MLQSFKEYFTYMEPIVNQRWVKTVVPGKNPPDLPVQNLASHMYPKVRLEPQRWEIQWLRVSTHNHWTTETVTLREMTIIKKEGETGKTASPEMYPLTLLHSERPKVLAVLSAIGLILSVIMVTTYLCLMRARWLFLLSNDPFFHTCFPSENWNSLT